MPSLHSRLALRALVLALCLAMNAPAWVPALHAGQLPTTAATLAVTSEPAGAEVFVDGQRAGTTPLTLTPISPGEHRVRVAMDGFLENARVINVRQGRTETHRVRLTSRGPAANASPATAQAPQGLKIVVVEGEDLVNIIQQRTAVRTVVEVRDRNDNPVSGAAVLFRLGGNGATLNGTGTTFSAVTNAAGQATVSVTPAASGAASGVNLSVTATFQGQTAATTVGSAAVAGTTSGTSAGAGGSGGGAGAGAGAGTAAATGAAASGGFLGLSTLALGGIIAGGATAGIVTAAAVSGDSNEPPTLTGGVTASASTGLIGINSTISFSAAGADPNNDSLTYTWAFGDGGTATGQNVTHNYATTGTFAVRVTVSDGKADATAETSVTIKSLSATWRSNDSVTSQAGTLNMVFALSVSGTTITGNFSQGAGSGPITGTLSATSPNVTFQVTPTLNGQTFTPFTFTGNISAPFDSVTGVLNGSGYSNTPLTIARQ